jgi:hypothetical protein
MKYVLPFQLKVTRHFTVIGKLRGIDHAAGFVNGTFVPGWTEIRLDAL